MVMQRIGSRRWIKEDSLTRLHYINYIRGPSRFLFGLGGEKDRDFCIICTNSVTIRSREIHQARINFLVA